MKDRIYIWIFLLVIGTINSRGYAPTLARDACPSPSERAGAWNIGETCDNMLRSCCFDEEINNSHGNLTNVSCCYTYGTAGPIKCCGWTYFPLWALGIIIPMAVWIGIVLLLCSLRIAYEKKDDDTCNSTDDTCNSIDDTCNSTKEIELENDMAGST
jgi:hypothetical protein